MYGRVVNEKRSKRKKQKRFEKKGQCNTEKEIRKSFVSLVFRLPVFFLSTFSRNALHAPPLFLATVPLSLLHVLVLLLFVFSRLSYFSHQLSLVISVAVSLATRPSLSPPLPFSLFPSFSASSTPLLETSSRLTFQGVLVSPWSVRRRFGSA